MKKDINGGPQHFLSFVLKKKMYIQDVFYFLIILLAFQDKVLNYTIFLNGRNCKLHIEKMTQEKK